MGIVEALARQGGHTCPPQVQVPRGTDHQGGWVTALPEGEGQRMGALGISILAWGFHTPPLSLSEATLHLNIQGLLQKRTMKTLGAILFLGMSLVWLTVFVLFFLPI